MASLTLDGRAFDCAADETVLDALLRQGEDIPYSCRKGTCGTCLMRSENGDPPKASQAGLRETLRSQRFFHACQCVPTGDMEIALPRTAIRTSARVVHHERVAPTICKVKLQLPESFEYKAGQSILLHRPDGVARSYSLATTPNADRYAELHVRIHEGGKVSRWLGDGLKPGDHVEIQGPFGDCIYVPGSPEAPMLLIATGTGLAPLLAIARDAIDQGHRGRIVLYHGVRKAVDSYAHEALCELQTNHPNVEVHLCVSGEEPSAGFTRGRADDLAFARFEDLTGWRVYLCGAPGMVSSAKRAAYLAGARMEHICSDAFESASPVRAG